VTCVNGMLRTVWRAKTAGQDVAELPYELKSVSLREHINTIHKENPEFATATSCMSSVDHQTTDGRKKCKTCHPWGSD